MTNSLSDRTLRRLSWACFAFYLGSVLLNVVCAVLDPTVVDDWGSGGVVANVSQLVMTALFPVVGILIIRRQPRNVVGWLLHATGLAWGLGALTDAYTRLALHLVPTLPGGQAVEVVSAMLWWPPIVMMGCFTILFFPDGRLPSPRWRFLPWLAGLDCLLGVVVFSLSPGKVSEVLEPLAQNPLDVGIPLPVIEAMEVVLLPLLPICILAAAASLVVRFRRSGGVERVQLKWLMSAVVFMAVTYAVAMVGSLVYDGTHTPLWLGTIENVALFSFGLIPITIGIAITRHGLYGIDALITRALVVGALGVFITAVYVGVVVGIGTLIGQHHPSVWLSVIATAVVAVAFQPVRERVTRGVNRLVYGSRATPYEVLSDFASSMTGTYTTAELLPRIAQMVSDFLGGARVQVWLRSGQRLEPEISWPVDQDERPTAPVLMAEPESVTGLSGDRVVPVRHRDELLGAIAITKPSSEPVTPAEEEMLEQVASQAGLVLRNLRLVDDLQSSRQRLVTSQDVQRRRIERDLHDGAQQSLVAIALMLRMATNQSDPAALSRSATDAADALQSAIAELRELARGLHPAILTDRGLAPALSALAERCPVPVRLDTQLSRRVPGPVEGALYFVAAESLTNVAKYAHATEVAVIVTDLADSVTLEVRDDGVGGADAARGSGLVGLTDRVAVVDGTFTVHSPPGQGTTIRCVVPVPAVVPEQRPAVSAVPAMSQGAS
jgi:signal transduction histidine kinase